MTEPPNDRTTPQPRALRLADALRANLKRRKSQARGRAAQTTETSDDDGAPGLPAADRDDG